jgi:hypothetical protein
VRVWWPPTRDPAKTGFSGALWPAKVMATPASSSSASAATTPGAEWVIVRYDNGDKAKAFLDDVFPPEKDVPVAFGAERVPLKPGEFVEVHNGSASDPAAWLAVARKVSAGGGGGGGGGGAAAAVLVSYPFHDTAEETVAASRVRRARVWEEGGWQFVKPGQRWPPGEVTSPRELELMSERDYFRKLGVGGGGGQAAAPKAPKAAVAPTPKKAAPAPGKRPVGRPPKNK